MIDAIKGSALRPPIELKQIAVGQTPTLRHEVLWPDLPIENVRLAEDENGWHFGAFVLDPSAEDDPIAVISLFCDPIPSENDDWFPRETVRFRKFACKKNMQGRGIGAALLKHAMEFARSKLDARVVWCDARASCAEWYERRGLVQFGSKFYKGPIEYVRMKIELE